MLALASSLRNVTADLDLVTRIYREDGSSVEIVNERRGVIKSTRRAGNTLSLEHIDLDRAALDTLLPAKRYTLADFPKLFVDHVGRAVAQVIGDAIKVPLTYIDNTASAFRYLACEVIGSTPTVRTIYRNGRIVSSSEYTVDTTAVSGTTYLRITFTAEQKDFNGSLYELTADILGPGSRAAADEISRILLAVGATVDSSSFTAAALYHSTNHCLVDCGYVEPRAAIAIVQDLLAVARAQLYKTPAGAFGIFVDKPRDVRLALDDQSEELKIDELVRPEISQTLTLEYRPSSSSREAFTGKLSRTTAGVAGERVYRNPYIRDHETADRWLCYMQKRESARVEARGTIFGVQLRLGDLVAVSSIVTWGGDKVFAAPQIQRPADANAVTLLEYDATIYDYTAGALPADATNIYQPDYSQTPPAAPTGLTVVSQGTSSDPDGKTRAYALMRATPPAVNWARVMVEVKDTTTNEIYQAQLRLVAGNYEAVVSGLRPNRAHTVVAWAVNANDLDGAATASVPFTSANYTTQPSAPASVGVQQTQSKALNIKWSTVARNSSTSPTIAGYRVFEKEGAGGTYTQIHETSASAGLFNTYTRENVSTGTTYYYKIRAFDVNGNESNDSSEVNIVVAKMIDDSYVVGQGISGPSIADSSINRGRGYTSTGSSNATANAGGGTASFGLDVFCFFPGTDRNSGAAPVRYVVPSSKGSPADTAYVQFQNDDPANNASVTVDYRRFLA